VRDIVLVNGLFTLSLLLIGFAVGVLSGFFGVGGGFMITPFLFSLGLPMNAAVGTSIAQIAGSSVIAAMRHRRLGHVDARLGIILSAGSAVGMEVGARLIESLEGIGIAAMDSAVSLTYVVLLGGLAAYMVNEARRSMRNWTPPVERGIVRRVRGIRLRPLLAFPASNIPSVSLWAVLLIGFTTGVLAGFMGAGGGFIQVPLMVYAIGCTTAVAVGTSALGIAASSAYGCFSHALKGNVNLLFAAIMLAGAAVGTEIGVFATKHVKGPAIRVTFGFCIGLAGLGVLWELLAKVTGVTALTSLSQMTLVLAVGATTITVVASTIKALRKNGDQAS